MKQPTVSDGAGTIDGSQVVVLRQREGKREVLLVKRDDVRVWTVPGGVRGADESPEGAAIRETYEETGYRVRLIRRVGIFSLPQLPMLRPVALFVGKVLAGSAQTSDETIEVNWFAFEDLPPTLLPYQRERIECAISGRENVVVAQPFSERDIFRYYDRDPAIRSRLRSAYDRLRLRLPSTI